MAKDGAQLVQFEDGMSWLPAQVLHEACGFDDNCFSKGKLAQRARLNQQNNHHYPQHVRLIGEPLPHPRAGSSPMRSKPCHRARYNNKRASGGPGMQAIFLDSSQKPSSGTGVFLPRRTGSNSQPTQKPDGKTKQTRHSDQFTSLNPQTEQTNASPEIILPKEWIY